MSKISVLKDEGVRFFQHLKEDNNSRIIFSAPFGVGKTSFLKELSTESVNKQLCPEQDFNFFHIYPVNYSVATNEDIFQYIKYDLIYTLIEKNVAFQKEDFKFLNSFKKYLKSNAHKLAAKLFLFIPQVGKDLHNIFEHLDKVKDEIIEACQEDAPDEGEKFYEYLLEIENKAGSIYEMDIYTRLIKNVLERIKGGTKQNVLVIDDLDRMDPHHIFRLLNVFSAHFDTYQESNKFGFDKIVFVCDLNNIRKIFSNLYGSDVDFNGYIDKFYSKTVFQFLNHESLINNLTKKLNLHNTQNDLDFHSIDKQFTSDILRVLVKHDKCNYRSILKIEPDRISDKLNSIYKNYSGPFFSCRLLKIGVLLRDVFGNYESLIKAIDEMYPFYNLNQEKYERFVSDSIENVQQYYRVYLIVPLYFRKHQWKNDSIIDIKNHKFQFKTDSRYSYYVNALENTTYPTAEKTFWDDLKKALEVFHDQGLLQ